MLSVVAPVRERGLKSQGAKGDKGEQGRSRKGAWIEICINIFLLLIVESLP